jgi:hypothetical protein
MTTEKKRFRFRQNWRGKMILQVEKPARVNYDPNDLRLIHLTPRYVGVWKDAGWLDITEPQEKQP